MKQKVRGETAIHLSNVGEVAASVARLLDPSRNPQAMLRLYQAYKSSPYEHRLFLQLMAFLDDVTGKSVATQTFNEMMDRHGRRRVAVAPMIERLVQQRLLESVSHNRYRLAPSILEDVAADASRESVSVRLLAEFSQRLGSRHPLAVERRRWLSHSPNRTVEEFFAPRNLERLSLGITRAETLDAFPEALGLELVGRILARALTSDIDSEPFLEWLETRLAQAPILAREAYGHLRLLRGESEFLPLLTRHHPDVLTTAFREILGGDTAKAVRKLQGVLEATDGKARFPFVTQEFFYLVGCLVQNKKKALNERVKKCPSEVGTMVLALQKARATRRSLALPAPTSKSYEVLLADLLCRYWSGEIYGEIQSLLPILREHFSQRGFSFLDELLQAIQAGTSHPVLDLMGTKSGWEKLLDQLDGWSQGRSGTPSQAASPERVVWMVDFSRDASVTAVYPKVQSRTKKGGWSVGRRKSPYNLRAVDQHDLRVQALWTEGVDYSYDFYETEPELGEILEALIDHPRIYDGAKPDRRLTFSRQSPQLTVEHQGEGLHLQLKLGRRVSEGVFCQELSSGCYGVLVLTERLSELQKLLGDVGFHLPPEGLERAQQTLSRMVGEDLELTGDLPTQIPGVTPLVADSRLRVRLSPLEQGLSWTVRVVPDEERRESFEPGSGSSVLTFQRAGKLYELTRDLKKEKAALRKLCKTVPLLASGSESPEPGPCLELLEALKEVSTEDCLLEWPEGEKFRLRPKLDSKAFQMSVSGRQDWFEVQGELTLSGEEKLSLAEVLTRLREGGRFLQLADGSYQALTEELRRRLAVLERSADRGHEGGLQLPWIAASLLDDQEVKGDDRWREQVARLQRVAALEVATPRGLTAELRSYQEDGFRWLARSAEWGVGVCLADDMGLGKTLQTLTLLLRRKQDGPALVVAPTSVGANWMEESQRFAPDLRPHLYSESDRETLLQQAGPGDVVVCTYGLLVRDIESLKKVRWSTVVLDEAQAIKNSTTLRFKAAVALQAGFRVATTGTPVENHLDELWALFRFLNPALLGSKKRFSERFGSASEDPVATAALSALVRPFILRRLKSQVLKELPPRTEITLEVELSREERIFYEGLRRDAVQRMEESPELKLFTVLVELTKLRRACCHPSLVKGGQDLESSKLHMFRKLLTEIVGAGHRVLVFSQFVDHLKLAVSAAEELGLGYRYLDGATPTARRRKEVQEFQEGNAEIFFISLKAGGVGLNLTAANYVVHLDPWWNPAAEDQASDRAHRLGQLRPVTVYRLITKETIEEKILRLHADKRELADNLLSGTDQAAGMKAEEILELLRSGEQSFVS